MIEHRFIILDRGGQRIGEIVNYTYVNWAKVRNRWGFLKITIPLDVPEARLDYLKPIEHRIEYYRDDVLWFDGIITTRKYNVTDTKAELVVSALSYLFLLHKRKKDEFNHINKTGSQLIADALQEINDEYYTGIYMGESDIDINLGAFDRLEYNISMYELLQTFDPLGFEYQIRKDGQEHYLDFKTSLGEEKIDAQGNPTYVLFNGEGGNIESWEHEIDATNYANQIIALGSGSGITQARYTAVDFFERDKNGLFQEIKNYPGDGENEESLLELYAENDLSVMSKPVETFEFTMTKGVYDFKSFDVCDIVYVNCTRQEYKIDKFVRIDAIEVEMNSGGFEDVKLTVNIIL